MMRNTTVDSAMTLSLVSWPPAARPEVKNGSAATGGAQRAHSALAPIECSIGSRRGSVLAGVDRGGIRPVPATMLEQAFGSSGEMALNRDRDHESAFVSKVTYGRSHDPGLSRRRGEG